MDYYAAVPPGAPVSPATWTDALQAAGGPALVRRALAAGLDSPEALAERTTASVLQIPGLGRETARKLRRAALSVGLDWGADLERRPGAASLSGAGESPRHSVALPVELAERVEALAVERGESISAWIRRAVEDRIQRETPGQGRAPVSEVLGQLRELVGSDLDDWSSDAPEDP